MPPRWILPSLLVATAGCQVRTVPSEAPDSAKVVEVLLPRHTGPKLHSIEIEANAESNRHDECRVVDSDLSAPSKDDAVVAEPG